MGAQHNKLMDTVAGSYHVESRTDLGGNGLSHRDRIEILDAEVAVRQHLGHAATSRPPEQLSQHVAAPLQPEPGLPVDQMREAA